MRFALSVLVCCFALMSIGMKKKKTHLMGVLGDSISTGTFVNTSLPSLESDLHYANDLRRWRSFFRE
jgi:hypothetical protein